MLASETGSASHEVERRGGFDLWEHFADEIIVAHGFIGGLHRFFHVFADKTIIALQVAIAIKDNIQSRLENFFSADNVRSPALYCQFQFKRVRPAYVDKSLDSLLLGFALVFGFILDLPGGSHRGYLLYPMFSKPLHDFLLRVRRDVVEVRRDQNIKNLRQIKLPR